MRLQALLVALLLLPLAALPTASAASSVSIDAEALLLDADRQRLVVTLTEGREHFSPWRLVVPEGLSFVEARDARGVLSATVEGDRVSVQARGSGASYWFQVAYEGPTVRQGPFVILEAGVSAPEDAATSTRAILPEGWRLVGWRAGDLAPDASGILRDVGPFAARYLALPADLPHGPADARVSGNHTLREAAANVTPEGVDVRVRLTYDTDVYGSAWTFLLPEGATLVGAASPYGPLGTTPADGGVEVEAPYPFAFHLGARWIETTWRLPPPAAYGGGFREAWISVPSGTGSRTTLDVTLDPAFALAGANAPDDRRTGPLSFADDGPLGVKLALVPPLAPDQVEIVTDAFVARAPADLADDARATLEEASRRLATVAGFLGGGRLSEPFHVLYTREDVFHWETGFYTRGLNTISIDAASLEEATQRPDLVPVGTLLHETAHGLVDRLFPGDGREMSFFDEGLARLVETHLEYALPEQVVRCESTADGRTCNARSARPGADALGRFYREGRDFPIGWSADASSDEERGFLYDYSGLVFHAYQARAPPGALAAVLANLSASGLPEGDAQALDHLVEVLLAHAPGLSRDALLHPGRALAGSDDFRGCLGALLQPPFPWEEVPAPSDCRGFRFDLANVTASMGADGPAPPDPYVLLPEPTPEEGAAQPWSPATPPRVTPPGATGGSDDAGGAPAAVGDAPGATGGATVHVPGPAVAWIALAALVATLALGRRR